MLRHAVGRTLSSTRRMATKQISTSMTMPLTMTMRRNPSCTTSLQQLQRYHHFQPSLGQGSTQEVVSRSFSAATSRQKRALNKQQLDGTSGSSTSTTATTTGASAAAPTAAPAGNDSSSSTWILMSLVLAGGLGGAYAMGIFPPFGQEEKETKDDAQEVTESKSASDSTTTETTATTTTTTADAATPDASEETTNESEQTMLMDHDSTAPTGRVSQIALPKGTKPSASLSSSASSPQPVEHPSDGHKVVMDPSTPTPIVGTTGDTTAADAKLIELKQRLASDSTRALSEAHKELASLSSLDMTELDNLSVTQLKVRLVQMAKDMEERPKWEAVRFKEMLALRERELADEYSVLIKKQKLESEALMERRLKDQEAELKSNSQAVLKSKEEGIQSMIDAALKLQENEFLEEKASFEQLTEAKMSAKYEEICNHELAKEKTELTERMDAKLKLMESLSKKLSQLELALKTSRDFQSGSLQAHRMSAAALALVDRLESSQPADGQVAALQKSASNNPVIQAALETLPSSAIAGAGVPTLQELQTRFEETSYPKSRQAAMVPKGVGTGMEGQLLGIALAAIKVPPGPDDAAPSDDQRDAAEYVLSRARRHVQLGELEQAVSQLDKLDGQAAFTVQDWKELAKERVLVDKVLKLLRVECALANESMSNK